MHALGAHHEHVRSDRDLYINVNMDNTNVAANNFDKIDAADQEVTNLGDRVNSFEMKSVLMYSSFGGSSNGQPVMSLLDGGTWGGNVKMTTADAKQLQWKYCRDRVATGFQYKSTLNCTSQDRLGFDREVFNDRICDAYGDCPDFEDELSLAACQPAATTAAGCCTELLFQGSDKCTSTGATFGAREYWVCESSPNNIILFVNNQWYRSVTGLPSGKILEFN